MSRIAVLRGRGVIVVAAALVLVEVAAFFLAGAALEGGVRLRVWLLMAMAAIAPVSALAAILLAPGFAQRCPPKPAESTHDIESDAVRIDEAGSHQVPGLRTVDAVLADPEAARRESEMLRLAYVDVLTGLPNRAAFNEKLAQALKTAAASGGPLTVMMMDLDRFKAINDTLGHVAGDETLRQVGARLQVVLRDADTVARLGGDEFALLLSSADRDAVIGAARRILQALRAPVHYEGQPIDVGTSIGIARYPEHGDDAVTLLRHADVAMYAAKRGNTGYAIYKQGLDEAQRAHLSLLGELRRAVRDSELRVYYQPQIDLLGGRVEGAEALVRWRHPTRGLLPPGEFIPYAEKTGFVRAITHWMLEVTLRQCGRWSADGTPLRISVNVSARDLMNPDFAHLVGESIRTHQVPPHLICLEITESSLLEDPDRASVMLRLLHRLGVRLSIDDFGTGFSSLAWLKRMPVDELKIDRSFVAGMRNNRDDQVIVRSTIELAHNLGLQVVAEGVDNEKCLATLRTYGCDLAQGFFISGPMRRSKLEAWVRESVWAPTTVTQESRTTT